METNLTAHDEKGLECEDVTLTISFKAGDVETVFEQRIKMVDQNAYNSNRWRRFSDWDARPLRLDQFAVEDPKSGFAAFSGGKDPRPGTSSCPR